MEIFATPLFNSLLIVVLAAVILILIQIVARRIYKSVKAIEGIRQERRQQTITFLQVVVWSISVTAVCIAVLMILSEYGVDITPLLASAGIAGLALSLGAQTLIKDFIGGFLILLENQYVVGDTIQLDTLTGEVERITLRATYVRDIKGLQHIVPNGEVRIVANQNRDWARALVDFNVAYDENLDHVVRVLEGVAVDLANDPDFEPDILDQPKVSGPIVLGDWAITMRIMVKTQPNRQVEITRELQKRVLQACDRAGISYPRPNLWQLGSDGTS